MPAPPVLPSPAVLPLARLTFDGTLDRVGAPSLTASLCARERASTAFGVVLSLGEAESGVRHFCTNGDTDSSGRSMDRLCSASAAAHCSQVRVAASVSDSAGGGASALSAPPRALLPGCRPDGACTVARSPPLAHSSSAPSPPTAPARVAASDTKTSAQSATSSRAQYAAKTAKRMTRLSRYSSSSGAPRSSTVQPSPRRVPSKNISDLRRAPGPSRGLPCSLAGGAATLLATLLPPPGLWIVTSSTEKRSQRSRFASVMESTLAAICTPAQRARRNIELRFTLIASAMCRSSSIVCAMREQLRSTSTTSGFAATTLRTHARMNSGSCGMTASIVTRRVLRWYSIAPPSSSTRAPRTSRGIARCVRLREKHTPCTTQLPPGPPPSASFLTLTNVRGSRELSRGAAASIAAGERSSAVSTARRCTTGSHAGMSEICSAAMSCATRRCTWSLLT